MPAALRLLLALMLCSPPAAAVLIDSGDGTGNISAPSPDPGWANVGFRGSLSAVYLGNSYVITAAHAGFGDVVFNGTPHRAVPGTDVILRNPDSSATDLRLFSIHPAPALPALPVSAVAPEIGDQILLAGNGRDRGAETSFDPNGPPPPGPVGGHLWLGSQSLRWGTNEVDSFSTLSLGGAVSESFSALFDAGSTPHEGVAATGDSGGAVFHNTGSQWELAGIMVAVSQFVGQPANTSIYGNGVISVDLSVYRDDIMAVVALPEPSGGLWWGALAVLVLASRRGRR
jgi:hypothetical protein